MSKRKKEAEAAAAEAEGAEEEAPTKKKHRIRKLAIIAGLAGAVAVAKKKLGGGSQPGESSNDSPSQPPSA